MTRADHLGPELVAQIDATRAALSTALGRQRRDVAECWQTFDAYAEACAQAGVRIPPDWRTWPPPGTNKTSQAMRRAPQATGASGAGDERNTA